MSQRKTVPLIVATWSSAATDVDEPGLVFFNTELCPIGYVELARTEAIFELPPRSVRVAREVAQLRTRVEKLRADAEVEARKLEDRINNLLALEYDGASDVS